MPGLSVQTRVEQVYREESRRILATLIRLLGDFDLAEEALHEALFVAVERWQQDGVPDNPRTWLVSTGRFKAIVFNEGYSASIGAQVTREELTREAIRLGRLLMQLLPEPEVMGLLALMLLHESRRLARTSDNGELIVLDEQDRALWDAQMIAEGCALVERALSTRRFGPYCLQAAIAAVHAEAQSVGETDWAQIVGLYDVLLWAVPSPVIELNRVAALAKRDGPLAGLAGVEAILDRGELQDCHLAHSARAEFCRQLGGGSKRERLMNERWS